MTDENVTPNALREGISELCAERVGGFYAVEVLTDVEKYYRLYRQALAARDRKQARR